MPTVMFISMVQSTAGRQWQVVWCFLHDSVQRVQSISFVKLQFFFYHVLYFSVSLQCTLICHSSKLVGISYWSHAWCKSIKLLVHDDHTVAICICISWVILPWESIHRLLCELLHWFSCACTHVLYHRLVYQWTDWHFIYKCSAYYSARIFPLEVRTCSDPILE